jgi:tetratricopeptide (TPR) repeat protein
MSSLRTQASITIGCILLSLSISGCIKHDWKSSYDQGEKAYDEEEYASAERAFKIAISEAENEKPLTGKLPMSLNALANVYRDAPGESVVNSRPIKGINSSEDPNYEKAIALYKRCIDIWTRMHSSEFNAVAEAEADLAQLYFNTDNFNAAEPLLKHATSVLEKEGKSAAYVNVDIVENLAEIYRKQGKFVDAELLLKRWIAIREQKCPPRLLEDSLCKLAAIYTEDHKYSEAELVYKRLIDTNDSFNIAAIYKRYADLLEKANRPKEAAELMAKAKILAKKSPVPGQFNR